MKVYLDNMIASASILDDLGSPTENKALRLLQASPHVGKLEIVTSRESWREQDRTKDPPTREKLQEGRSNIGVVPDDHRVLGFNTVDYGYYGFITSPLVTDIVDESMFATLQGLDLKAADARHLMYALSNGCVRFVTTDPDFIDRRSALEAAYPQIRIVKPSELLQELEAVPSA